MSDKKNKKIETPVNPETAVAVRGPSAAMTALFAPRPGLVDSKKVERRNFPQMVKPADVPIGGVICGEIVKIVNSPVSTIKGKLLWLRNVTEDKSDPAHGQEFTFPCTGVIRSALAPGVEGDKELQTALEKEIGKTLIAKRMDDKQSAKYKKNMFVFDVYTISP